MSDRLDDRVGDVSTDERAGPRHFLSIDDLTPRELAGLLDDADRVKADPQAFAGKLAGRQVAMLFEKPSTRTRVSLDSAAAALGCHVIVLRGDELQLGRDETIEDTGRVLSRYVDAIAVRTFAQERLERLAAASTVPILNALSDFSHPCQGLADLQTIREKKGALRGVALAYLGDGNNVAHSLLLGGAKSGMDVRAACPPGYEPLPEVVERSNEVASGTGGRITVTHDLAEALMGADVLYTDVWTSMGQEQQGEKRRLAFQAYQLNAEAVAMGDEDAIVMHCLPAHRGEEITAEVLEGPRSVVWEQAENRLHTQKALLAWLLS